MDKPLRPFRYQHRDCDRYTDTARVLRDGGRVCDKVGYVGERRVQVSSGTATL